MSYRDSYDDDPIQRAQKAIDLANQIALDTCEIVGGRHDGDTLVVYRLRAHEGAIVESQSGCDRYLIERLGDRLVAVPVE